MIGPGTELASRYEIISYVASGGMQDVYRAHDKLTGEIVALKTPQAGQANRRFKQSAVLSARINNYNVAKTFDYFEVGNACYLIEEYVEGTTLEAATLEVFPQIDPHLAAYLMLRISKGLAASHHAQVAHRDLKPSNILVGAGFSSVKITDFGIATLADELFEEVAKSGDLTRSTSGTVKGALPYMAPEMIFRKPGDHVGSEADIWSLGALMFRLMTGVYPFGEGMMVPVNVEKRQPLVWPNFLTGKAQFAPLSNSLTAIVEKCLVHDKTQRPLATDLVHSCEELCFHFSPREFGLVSEVKWSTGFVRSSSGEKIFFHKDSLYGSLRAQVGSKVVFSAHQGSPFPRAHPIVVCQ
ncbi:serine/threonine protein kinase [Bradyrhizobium sp. AC87j1]|uniref:serine/threonine-protein kinase n=1 Tax=Bradyrhizobium sp. AC87j1 TaxID=2055894 RepID=UPI000CEC661F|nr:serine/threonine-protein kinase [Bradyrhizobium sp. AC87j1]PPQ14546.1 serine/threonine protein kinase [Bradyrhizobium sp. AC87j1]